MSIRIAHYVQQDDNPRSYSFFLFFLSPPSSPSLSLSVSQSLANKSLLQHREHLRTRWYLASVSRRSMNGEQLTSVAFAMRWTSRVTSRPIRWKSSLFCSAIRVVSKTKINIRNGRGGDERRERKWKGGGERDREETGRVVRCTRGLLRDCTPRRETKRPSIDEHACRVGAH